MFTVKRLETLKGKPSDVKLILDDGSSYAIGVDIVAKFALHEGKEINSEELENILRDNFVKVFLEKTIGYILYSPRSEHQVKMYLQKLCRRYNVGDFVIDEVVKKLKEFKYINDEEFAEVFVNSRLKNKPRSRYVLEQELFSKGVEKELVNKVLDRILPEESEILKNLYYKKYGSLPLKIEDKKKIGFLQRKGFSWDKINELIKSFENNDT
jgi:regulatory protein